MRFSWFKRTQQQFFSHSQRSHKSQESQRKQEEPEEHVLHVVCLEVNDTLEDSEKGAKMVFELVEKLNFLPKLEEKTFKTICLQFQKQKLLKNPVFYFGFPFSSNS